MLGKYTSLMSQDLHLDTSIVDCMLNVDKYTIHTYISGKDVRWVSEMQTWKKPLTNLPSWEPLPLFDIFWHLLHSNRFPVRCGGTDGLSEDEVSVV